MFLAPLVIALSTPAHAEETSPLGPNPSCLVDGAWSSAAFDGKPVETTFSAGVLSTRTADGRRSAGYEVKGGAVVVSGGSLGKAPRGEPRTCDLGEPATYTTRWSKDCWTLQLVAEDESCERRKAQLEAVTFRRGG